MVFGCGNFGGMGSSAAYRDYGDGRMQAFALLHAARDAGLTRFDTANTYGGGASETWLGAWLSTQDRAWRSQIQVATKLGNPAGCPPGETPLSRRQVELHLDQSLRRLGVERLDLLYLHEFDPHTPLEETLEAIERAVGAGKLAAFGVSNADAPSLRAVLDLAGARLRPAFSSVQNEFNALAVRDREAVIPLCQAEGLRYVAFSPLAGGVLTGKYQRGRPAAQGTRVARAGEHYAPYLTDDAFDVVDGLAARARAQGWTTPGAALRFVLDAPGVDALIIAPRTRAHFESYGLYAPLKGCEHA